MSIIYKYTNKINNISYIGKTTTSLNKRKKGGYGNTYFSKALKKYGYENFNCEILWKGNCSNKWLNELEKYYIYFYDTHKNGYNMTTGGEISPMLNPIIAKKCSLSLKGRIFSEEHKKKISKSHKKSGLYIGKNNPMYGIKRNNEKNPFYGKKHSEETLKKMRKPKSEEHKKKISKSKRRKWILKDIKTGEKIIIENLKKFCEENNVNYNSIKARVRDTKMYKQWRIEQ